MSTIECTKQEYYKAWHDFRRVQGSTESTQEEVALAHKCLVLHYIGMQDVTQEEIESCATFLEIATKEAMMRGWTLMEPDLSGGGI